MSVKGTLATPVGVFESSTKTTLLARSTRSLRMKSRTACHTRQRRQTEDVGSIIIIVATDAPLLPHQLKRIARRASHGLARTGGTSGNSSGDIFIAFSTANSEAGRAVGVAWIEMLPNDEISPLFEATAQATEEAIINAMLGAETMTGIGGHTAIALPHDRLRDVMRRYNRLR